MIIWKNIIKKKRKIEILVKIIFKNLVANIFPFFFNKLEYIGNKEDVKAPSAVILRNKLGNLKAIKKISEEIPAPKKAAIKTSLTKPEMRLKNVMIAD